MIPPVQAVNNQNSAIKTKAGDLKAKAYRYPIVDVTDRFVKHSVESLPVLTGMALIWSFIDKGNGVPFSRAFLNNTKNIILPVMIVTSAITTFVEAKNNKAK